MAGNFGVPLKGWSLVVLAARSECRNDRLNVALFNQSNPEVSLGRVPSTPLTCHARCDDPGAPSFCLTAAALMSLYSSCQMTEAFTDRPGSLAKSVERVQGVRRWPLETETTWKGFFGLEGW